MNEELVGEEDGDIVDAPGHGEFGARPRGGGALQNMLHIDGGGHDSEDRSDIIEGNGERGAIGDVDIDGEGEDLEDRREIIE